MRLKNLEIMKNWKGTKSPIHEDGVYCDTLNGVSNELLNESDQVVVDVYGSDVDEMNANTALVLDSFQTIQKCDLLPSELLKQRDELLEALKNAEYALCFAFDVLDDAGLLSTLNKENHRIEESVNESTAEITLLIKKIQP
jgi:hypothetical protein